jgi:hypothetical protein
MAIMKSKNGFLFAYYGRNLRFLLCVFWDYAASLRTSQEVPKNAAAAMYALMGDIDYAVGASHWDGGDFIKKGIEHRKIAGGAATGIQFTQKEHFTGMKIFFSGLKGFDNVNTDVTSFPLRYAATQGLYINKVLLKSVAQIGGTIFWAPNINDISTNDMDYDAWFNALYENN